MKLEDIQKAAKEDLKIEKEILDQKSTSIPLLHDKYLRWLTDEALVLKHQQLKHNQIVREKREYYLGQADAQVYKEKPFDLKVLRQDVDIYIDSDNDIIDSLKRIEVQKQKVNYLEATLKQITNMNWNIRNTIEFMKFLHGQ